MLGYKFGILLIISLFLINMSLSYADSISITFDKPEYHTDDSMVISGTLSDFKMPVIAMSLYDPDGKILSATNVIIDSNGTFSKIVSLDSPFYDKSGTYTVKVNYGKIIQNESFVIVGNIPEPEIITPETISPEIISLITDKNEYRDNDFVKISGLVSNSDSSDVLIGIYDPFDTPTGFYFGEINSDLKFSTSFLVKSGVNFKVDGTYSIKAHYGESEKIITFVFHKEPDVEKEHDNKPIIKNNDESKPVKDKISDVTIPQIINDQNIKSLDEKTPIKKYDNLSVHDIELGKLLNQINLDCDHSELVDTISYYDGMGPALYRLCKFEQALVFFNDSLTKDPNNVEIITNKGSALGKLGYISESVFYYDQALKIDPGFIPAINNKANSLANLGKFHESVILYNEAIQKNPDYNTAKKNLMLVLSKLTIEEKMVSLESESSHEEIPSEKEFHIENNSISETKIQSSFFEELSSLFSSIGSLFGFEN